MLQRSLWMTVKKLKIQMEVQITNKRNDNQNPANLLHCNIEDDRFSSALQLKMRKNIIFMVTTFHVQIRRQILKKLSKIWTLGDLREGSRVLISS